MALSESLKKLVNSTNQVFNRAVQLTGETIGSKQRTPYDDEVTKLMELSDQTQKCCTKLQSGVDAWLNTNPIDRAQEKVLGKFDAKRPAKLTSSELFGQLQLTMAQELAGSPLSIALSQYGSAEVDIGQAERDMITEIQNSLLAITKNYLEVLWPDIMRQRRSLEACRLDYDSVFEKRQHCVNLSKQQATAFLLISNIYSTGNLNTFGHLEALGAVLI